MPSPELMKLLGPLIEAELLCQEGEKDLLTAQRLVVASKAKIQQGQDRLRMIVREYMEPTLFE